MKLYVRNKIIKIMAKSKALNVTSGILPQVDDIETLRTDFSARSNQLLVIRLDTLKKEQERLIRKYGDTHARVIKIKAEIAVCEKLLVNISVAKEAKKP
jgi:uncharacterized protein involved in exopolysaccharide biosynthesis